MAQYKVPQDVEADDKLIGPFSFRQFVYLLIAGGLAALAVGLFQLFPILAIIPVPFILLLLALALPLKKDQPMETYLAALVNFYLKPRKKLWTPGQRDSVILITAPKIVEDKRSRDLSQEEATHRLSFLADIVDSGGYAIKGASKNSMREDLLAEANATTDMFDNYNAMNLNRAINQDREERHNDAVREMREAIKRTEGLGGLENGTPSIVGAEGQKLGTQAPNVQSQPASQPISANATPVAPSVSGITSDTIVQPIPTVAEPVAQTQQKPENAAMKPRMVELANNSDFSVATIAKEANRIKRKEDGEVFISLH